MIDLFPGFSIRELEGEPGGLLQAIGGAVRAWWQQRSFSGRGVPPPEKESDSAVIEFVRRTRGDIGYPSSAVSGVRIVPVRK